MEKLISPESSKSNSELLYFFVFNYRGTEYSFPVTYRQHFTVLFPSILISPAGSAPPCKWRSSGYLAASGCTRCGPTGFSSGAPHAPRSHCPPPLCLSSSSPACRVGAARNAGSFSWGRGVLFLLFLWAPWGQPCQSLGLKPAGLFVEGQGARGQVSWTLQAGSFLQAYLAGLGTCAVSQSSAPYEIIPTPTREAAPVTPETCCLSQVRQGLWAQAPWQQTQIPLCTACPSGGTG